MERRTSLITIRANQRERALLAAVAHRLNETEAGAFRKLLVEKAERLGLPTANDERQPDRVGVLA